jgi:hypothetical protein
MGGGSQIINNFYGAALKEDFDIDAIGEKLAAKIRLATGMKI